MFLAICNNYRISPANSPTTKFIMRNSKGSIAEIINLHNIVTI